MLHCVSVTSSSSGAAAGGAFLEARVLLVHVANLLKRVAAGEFGAQMRWSDPILAMITCPNDDFGIALELHAVKAQPGEDGNMPVFLVRAASAAAAARSSGARRRACAGRACI